MNRTIFVDTSGFKAILDLTDDFHLKAVKAWQTLTKEEITLITSNFILDESLTLLRSRLNRATAFSLRDLLLIDPVINILRVESGDEDLAWDWFEKDWSKLSFTDCVTFAQLKRLGVKEVFGYDKHFSRAGFVMLG